MELKIRIEGREMCVRPYVYFRTAQAGIISPNFFRIAEAGYRDGDEITAAELCQLQRFWEGVARDWKQRMTLRALSGCSTPAGMVVGGFAPEEEPDK